MSFTVAKVGELNTVTVLVHEAELLHPSVTVHVTIVLPSGYGPAGKTEIVGVAKQLSVDFGVPILPR